MPNWLFWLLVGLGFVVAEGVIVWLVVALKYRKMRNGRPVRMVRPRWPHI